MTYERHRSWNHEEKKRNDQNGSLSFRFPDEENQDHFQEEGVDGFGDYQADDRRKTGETKGGQLIRPHAVEGEGCR